MHYFCDPWIHGGTFRTLELLRKRVKKVQKLHIIIRIIIKLFERLRLILLFEYSNN
jgi:hypothetical protein